MESYKILGEGRRGSWPYEVGLRRAGDDDGLPNARPLGLSEGTGHGNQGGTFALAELLDPMWTEHLEMCDCGWLRDLAREEKARGQRFSADEIWARFEARQTAK